MTMSGMLAGTIVLVLALVGGAVATDAFERTAGHSWGSGVDTGNGTLLQVAPLSASTLARARLLCLNQQRHRHTTSAALSACAISPKGN